MSTPPVSPTQRAAWDRLWSWLLAPDPDEDATGQERAGHETPATEMLAGESVTGEGGKDCDPSTSHSTRTEDAA